MLVEGQLAPQRLLENFHARGGDDRGLGVRQLAAHLRFRVERLVDFGRGIGDALAERGNRQRAGADAGVQLVFELLLEVFDVGVSELLELLRQLDVVLLDGLVQQQRKAASARDFPYAFMT